MRLAQVDMLQGKGTLQYLSLQLPLTATGAGEVWQYPDPAGGGGGGGGSPVLVRAWRGGVRGVAGRLRLGSGKDAVDLQRMSTDAVGGEAVATGKRAPCKYVTKDGDSLAAVVKLYARVKGGDGKTAITVAGIQAENPYLRSTSGTKVLRGGLPIRLPGCPNHKPASCEWIGNVQGTTVGMVTLHACDRRCTWRLCQSGGYYQQESLCSFSCCRNRRLELKVLATKAAQ
jgi:hypothetical protein